MQRQQDSLHERNQWEQSLQDQAKKNECAFVMRLWSAMEQAGDYAMVLGDDSANILHTFICPPFRYLDVFFTVFFSCCAETDEKYMLP